MGKTKEVSMEAIYGPIYQTQNALWSLTRLNIYQFYPMERGEAELFSSLNI